MPYTIGGRTVMPGISEIMERAVAAAAAFRELDQKRTDEVVRAVYLAAFDKRVAFAKLAHEETGMGVWQHKVIKNVVATHLVYDDIKDLRTVGVLGVDRRSGIAEVAQPLGPILGLVPVTNPTSTAIFKTLICLKTRNPLVLCPPFAARRSVAAVVELCVEAALAAGAPWDCIQCIEKPAPQLVEEIMGDHRLALILATGTHSVVRKAHASGTPTIGVGTGNVPVYVGITADIPFAVRNIIESKTFDNGTVCASEQAVVVRRQVAGELVAELERQGAYVLSREQVVRVASIAYDRERETMSPNVVGQPVDRIANAAGITVPDGTVLLIARQDGVGKEFPLSAEILAPILALYEENGFEEAIARCSEIARFGGVGHSAVIYSNVDERIEYFASRVDVSRILVNMPSTLGALGGIYNTLSPSFTLGCGSGGRNITTDNITARHLLNIHRIARRRPNPRWYAFDTRHYLDESLPAAEIEQKYNRNC
ncbi:MAG: aldehyde dehydrogenase family protein [Pseudomonadota bacterium]